MTKLVIQGKNVEITDAIRSYVQEKIERAVSHFAQITSEVDVNLSVARNPRISASQSAEVTVYANGTVIRAEESSENLYASIDRVADKLARKLRKYKERNGIHRVRHTPKTSVAVAQQPVTDPLNTERQAELPRRGGAHQVLRHATHDGSGSVAPVGAGGSRLLRFSAISKNGEIIVIYVRNHGGYGLIRPPLRLGEDAW
jgi:putative sigma-54 modulation protein